MFAKTYLLPTALLAALASLVSAQSGDIKGLDGGLAGTVEVMDEMTIKITYTIEDASAPALYWWGSKVEDLGSGVRISDEHVTEPAEDKEVTIKLADGMKADDFSYVGLWCEQFNSNFGQAQLAEDGASSSGGDADKDSTDDKGSKDEEADKPSEGFKTSFGAMGALAAAVAVAGLMA